MATYALRADVEDVFGVENLKKWADLDGDADVGKIDARIVVALTKADEEVNGRLDGGPYEIPFTTEPYDGRLTSIAALWAGVWLYSNRGMTDNEGEEDSVGIQRREFERKCRAVKGSTFSLGSQDKIASDEGPSARPV